MHIFFLMLTNFIFEKYSSRSACHCLTVYRISRHLLYEHYIQWQYFYIIKPINRSKDILEADGNHLKGRYIFDFVLFICSEFAIVIRVDGACRKTEFTVLCLRCYWWTFYFQLTSNLKPKQCFYIRNNNSEGALSCFHQVAMKNAIFNRLELRQVGKYFR